MFYNCWQMPEVYTFHVGKANTNIGKDYRDFKKKFPEANLGIWTEKRFQSLRSDYITLRNGKNEKESTFFTKKTKQMINLQTEEEFLQERVNLGYATSPGAVIRTGGGYKLTSKDDDDVRIRLRIEDEEEEEEVVIHEKEKEVVIHNEEQKIPPPPANKPPKRNPQPPPPPNKKILQIPPPPNRTISQPLPPQNEPMLPPPPPANKPTKSKPTKRFSQPPPPANKPQAIIEERSKQEQSRLKMHKTPPKEYQQKPQDRNFRGVSSSPSTAENLRIAEEDDIESEKRRLAQNRANQERTVGTSRTSQSEMGDEWEYGDEWAYVGPTEPRQGDVSDIRNISEIYNPVDGHLPTKKPSKPKPTILTAENAKKAKEYGGYVQQGRDYVMPQRPFEPGWRPGWRNIDGPPIDDEGFVEVPGGADDIDLAELGPNYLGPVVNQPSSHDVGPSITDVAQQQLALTVMDKVLTFGNDYLDNATKGTRLNDLVNSGLSWNGQKKTLETIGENVMDRGTSFLSHVSNGDFGAAGDDLFKFKTASDVGNLVNSRNVEDFVHGLGVVAKDIVRPIPIVGGVVDMFDDLAQGHGFHPEKLFSTPFQVFEDNTRQQNTFFRFFDEDEFKKVYPASYRWKKNKNLRDGLKNINPGTPAYDITMESFMTNAPPQMTPEEFRKGLITQLSKQMKTDEDSVKAELNNKNSSRWQEFDNFDQVIQQDMKDVDVVEEVEDYISPYLAPKNNKNLFRPGSDDNDTPPLDPNDGNDKGDGPPRDDDNEIKSAINDRNTNAKRNFANMNVIEDGDFPDGDTVLRLYEHFPIDDLSEKVVPSKKEQLRGDVNFDTFGLVRDGYGLGENNKMYQQELRRENKLKRDFFFPRPWDGPTGGPDLIPVLAQNVIPKKALMKSVNELRENVTAKMKVLKKYQHGESSGVLGYDAGYILSTNSDKGLKRRRMTFLEPVIMNTGAFTRVDLNTGNDTSSCGFRSLYDPMRNDLDFSMNKRSRFSGDGKTLDESLATPYMQPLL